MTVEMWTLPAGYWNRVNCSTQKTCHLTLCDVEGREKESWRSKLDKYSREIGVAVWSSLASHTPKGGGGASQLSTYELCNWNADVKN